MPARKAAPHLHAVESGEKPKAVRRPVTMVGAVAGSRLDFMIVSRRKLAQLIDKGVPAHAFSRMWKDLERMDAEIRELQNPPKPDPEASDDDADGGADDDEDFDPEAE